MLQGQEGPGPLPGHVDAGPVDDGVRPGKVDELKHAQALFRLSAVGVDGLHAGLVRHHDLPGQDVPLKLGADGVQGAGLGGEHHAPVLQAAHAQRPEAVGVPDGDELGGGGDHQGVGPLDPVHGGGDSVLDRGGLQPLLDDDVGDDLRIRGGLENGAPALQLLPQLVGVGQVAVVGQGHAALVVVHQDGLDVALVVGPGGAVAHVAHGDGAGAQGAEPLLRKHVVHQPHIPVGGEKPVIVHYDARALLPPVLQGIQGIVGQGGHVGGLRGIDAEDPALLMQVPLRRGRGVSPHRGPAGAS